MKDKNISLKEMRKIEINILSNFASFCNENKLDYSLCGGTLLGAVRHKGFIPWDDDIDVFITRKTFNYLQKHFNKWGKKKNLKFINYHNRNYYSTFAKIIDTRTEAIEEKRNEKIGVWIDLFIVDFVKEKDLLFNAPIIDSLKELRYYGSSDYFPKINSIKNFLIFVKKEMVRFFQKPIHVMRIDRFIKKNHGNCIVSYSFVDQIDWWNLIDYLDFENSIEMVFEKNTYRVIGNWKDYLINRYGNNYMIPPPPKERTIHNLVRCKWKRYNKNDNII